MLELELVGPSLSNEDLDDINNHLSLVLPKSYRNFLLENNGGSNFTYYYLDRWLVSLFYAYEGENKRLVLMNKLNGAVPDGWFIFGSNGGLAYCIVLDGSVNNGKVYTVDETAEQDWVADSFEIFINGMALLPEEDDEI